MSNQLYDQDYLQWIKTTTHLLKNRDLEKVDYDNLIEELEDLGRSEKRALESNLIIVLVHILKWHYQPEKRCGSWSGSIREHQRRIKKALDDSPSLKNYVEAIFEECYQEATIQASLETGLDIATFPSNPILSIPDSLTQSYSLN